MKNILFFILLSFVFVGCAGNLPQNPSCGMLRITVDMALNCNASYETKKAFMHYYVDKCFAGEKVTLHSMTICGQMEEFEQGRR